MTNDGFTRSCTIGWIVASGITETTRRVTGPDVDTAGEKPADSVISAEIRKIGRRDAAHSCPHVMLFVGRSPERGISYAPGK
jgi:hypothetical protein